MEKRKSLDACWTITHLEGQEIIQRWMTVRKSNGVTACTMALYLKKITGLDQ